MKNQYTQEVILDDIIRFEQFCQFRSVIRGSKEHLIVGIDIAKDKHHAFFGTAYGKTLWRRLIFTNDLIGYQRLVEQTELLLKQHQLKEAVFGLEPTGNYHKPLAYWLIQHNYLVVLVAGKAVKDNRELLDGRRAKNPDTKDSANAADLVSQGKCQFYEQPDNVLIYVRNLIVVRKQLKMESCKYLGSLRKKIEDALGNVRHLTIEQKQKAWELFCQFLNNKNLERRVTPSS